MTDRAPASYRDRHSGVSFEGEFVHRTFDDLGADWFNALTTSGLIERLERKGLVVGSKVRSVEPLVVETPRLPTLTYPYEWSAEMLRDAAIATLDIAIETWESGFHLRDASAFNIVFFEGRPVLVDLGSIRPGRTPFFLAYGQFCDHFVNPLLLAAKRGLHPSRTWWTLEGVSAEETRRLLGLRAMFPPFSRHVWARARLERTSRNLDSTERKRIRQEYSLPPAAVLNTLKRLYRLIESLTFDESGAWESYESTCTYTDEASAAKDSFVSHVAARASGRKAVDIGANGGHYSGLISQDFQTVFAVESDVGAARVLYDRIKAGDIPKNVTPMIMDVLEPSPGRGLLNGERLSALDRLAGADLVLWLAVMHHMVVSRNVPLHLVFELALQLGDRHVFEWVGPEDPMSQVLLATRDETPWPLDERTFLTRLTSRFRLLDSLELTSTRKLFHAVAR